MDPQHDRVQHTCIILGDPLIFDSCGIGQFLPALLMVQMLPTRETNRSVLSITYAF